jgi:hypothetical protein
MTQPIRPEDVAARKAAVLPPEVIDAFNDLIAMADNGYSATVMQEDAIDQILDRLPVSREEIFDRHLLDIEPVYRAAGWRVTYDKPGFNESYQPYFIFTRAA